MLMGEEADGVLVGVVGSLVVEVHALLLHVCKSAVAGQPQHKVLHGEIARTRHKGCGVPGHFW